MVKLQDGQLTSCSIETYSQRLIAAWLQAISAVGCLPWGSKWLQPADFQRALAFVHDGRVEMCSIMVPWPESDLLWYGGH